VSKENFEQMLDYYQQEMIYLRRMGQRFAEQYPKIAENLNLSPAGSADPHVQRLLESFAFLTGRLQKEVDNRYIQFTNTLLGILYPQFVAPFPAATVATFRLSPHLGKQTSGYTVPRGTALFTEAQEKKICRFQTTYPVELWPFEVTEAEVLNIDQSPFDPIQLKTQWVLKIRVERYDGNMSELSPESLRFYLSGDTMTTQCLYDSMFSYLPKEPTPIYIQADGDKAPTQVKGPALLSVGFKEDEALIPYPHKSLEAYRLLHEYFVFPDKFKFFDIKNFSTVGATRYVDIFIPLADGSRVDKFRINKDNFVLGATPIINLFPKISEPINLNYQSISYRLVGDQRNEDSTEIHSVLKVVGAVPGGNEPDVYAPYFCYDYQTEESGNNLYWYGTRAPSEIADIVGTDVFLSFVDYKFTPQKPSNQVVYAYTLCTNRDLASFIPAGAALQVDGTIPPVTIKCIDRPSAEVQPSLDGESQWRLISQLSLNHLSLSGEDKAVSALKELLQLYSGFNRNKSHPSIQGISDITYEPVMRRRGVDAWRGFIQGISITLSMDEEPHAGHGGYMMASVLNEFFSLYVSLNSFTELTLISTQTDGVWKQWPAHIGSQPLL
jgi:type VI secretion system protein ImpG